MKTNNSLVRLFVVLLLATFGLLSLGAQSASAQAYDLDQCRNGAPDAHNNCGDGAVGVVGWSNGNAGAQNSHYAEGGSIAYRNKLTGLTPGIMYTLRMGFKIKHGDHHAIDYLTHVNRPGTVDVGTGVVDPCDGVGIPGVAQCPVGVNTLLAASINGVITSAADLPAPPQCDTPLNLGYTGSLNDSLSQACTSRLNLMANEGGNSIKMILVGGTFNGPIVPGLPGDLLAANSYSDIIVRFTPTVSTVVLAWGGHIGSRLDWGFIDLQGGDPASAGGIAGSPYHMDSKGLCFPPYSGQNTNDENCDVGGDQDRSLSAAAVIQPAAITIIKSCNPNDLTTANIQFNFSTTQPTGGNLDPNFPLLCADNPATLEVMENTFTEEGIFVFGTYTVTEAALTGWTLDSITCTDQDGGTHDYTTNVGARTVTIPLEAGEHATCTFNNRRLKGKVRVSKVLELDTNTANNNPPSSHVGYGNSLNLTPASWTIRVEDANQVYGQAAGEAYPAFDEYEVDPGTITVSESMSPAGYTFLALNCSLVASPDAPVAADATPLPGGSGPVVVGPGETYHCIFTNASLPNTIIVRKETTPSSSTNLFTFNTNFASPNNFDLNGVVGPTCATSTNCKRTDELSAGAGRTINEAAETGWDLTGLSCSVTVPGAVDPNTLQSKTTFTAAIANNPDVSITLGNGSTVDCTFINTQQATVTVTKEASPDDPQDFSFTTTGTGPTGWSSFNLDDDGLGGGDAACTGGNCLKTRQFTFSGTQLGPKSITEAATTGWALTSLSCSKGTSDLNTRTVNFTLDAGDAVTCTFNNSKPDLKIEIGPAAETNIVNVEHTFNVTITQIPNGATLDDLVDALSVAVDPAIAITDNTCVDGLTYGGDAVATCSFKINSSSAVVYTANAYATTTINGVALTRDTDPATAGTPAGPGGSGPAVKTYVDARISLNPLNAVNKTSDPNHEITATVQKDIGNGGFVAAEGVTVTFTVTSGVATFVGNDNDCVTNASGQCSVSITSTTPGNNVISATTSVTIDTETVVRTTGTAANTAAGGSGTAQKAYVNARIRIGDTETNQVGEQHTFTITVQQNTGSGWVAAPNGTAVTVTILPGGFTPVSDNCAAPGTVAGVCTVTINSNAPGVFTANATATFNVVANGLNEPFTVTTDGNGENSGAAIKTYEGGQIKIVKQVIPETDNTSTFNFTKNFGGPAIPALADDGEYLSIYLPVGNSYSVTETVPAGWELTSISCTLGGTRNGNAVESIVVSNNAINVCTFTNTAKGSITIRKETFEGNIATKFPDNFEFDPSAGISADNFFLDDDNDPTLPQQTTFNDVLAGSHNVAELAAIGWDLFNITCVNNNSLESTFTYTGAVSSPTTGFEFGDRTAVVALAPGSSVTCTFKNRQANMPVTKLIDGRTPDCSTPNPNQIPENPFDDFICTDPVMGVVTNLFGISLFQDTDPGSDTAGPGALIAGPVPIPPVFDPPAPIGVPFVICEMNIPAGWELITTGDVVLTPNPLPGGFDQTPTVYAGTGARDRCFDILIPSGTIDFAISIDNTPLSRIIVDKVTLPSGDAQSFNFVATGTGYNNFALTDEAAPNNQQVTGGNYSVTETVPGGWDLTNLQCSKTIPNSANNGNPAFNSSTINVDIPGVTIGLQPGATVSCTFTNTKRGRIIVDKVTNPSGDTQSFAFDASGGTSPAYTDFNLTDAADPNNQLLKPGTYSVDETPLPAGWTLTSATCVSSIADEETPSTLELDPGETITCTFTNTKDATIRVTKDAVPNDAQDFAFAVTGAGWNNFSLDDDADVTLPNTQLFTFSGANATGTKTVDEGDVAGWDLTALSCSKGTTTLATGVASIDLVPGDAVTCTYTNTKRGRIRVDKVTQPSGDTQSFNFDASGGTSPAYTDFSLTDMAAPNDQTLKPGSYSVSETVPAGWTLMSTNCVSDIGDTETAANLELDPGELITCTFTNHKDAKIRVTKVSNPDDPQNFEFATTGAGWSTFNLDDDGLGGGDASCTGGNCLDSRQFTFSGANATGTKAVTEGAVTGWDLTALSCTVAANTPAISITVNVGSRNASIPLVPGGDVTCTFTNRKRGTIIVIKDAVPNDVWDFPYTSPGLTPSSFSLDDDAGVVGGTNDLSNTITFNNVVPGQYVITETNDPAVSGHAITAITCDDAAGATDSVGNVGAGTATYNVDPGETVTCTFVNTRLIQARTIGYWSNWNSCTGGKQTANELIHPEKWLLDEVLGIDDPNDNEPQHYASSQLLIGVDGDTPDRPGQVDGTPDVVRTCADGVNLLRKRDVVSKENRANDGAYNMTAQLIAAMANYAAGATQCGTYNAGTNTGTGVTGAIGKARHLLVQIGFDGSGSFLPPGSTWRNYAIQLGSILDTYNNSNPAACSMTHPTPPAP